MVVNNGVENSTKQLSIQTTNVTASIKVILTLISICILIPIFLLVLISILIGRIRLPPQMPNLAGLPYSRGVSDGHELGRVRDNEGVVEVHVPVV